MTEILKRSVNACSNKNKKDILIVVDSIVNCQIISTTVKLNQLKNTVWYLHNYVHLNSLLKYIFVFLNTQNKSIALGSSTMCNVKKKKQRIL